MPIDSEDWKELKKDIKDSFNNLFDGGGLMYGSPSENDVACTINYLKFYIQGTGVDNSNDAEILVDSSSRIYFRASTTTTVVQVFGRGFELNE